MKLPELILAAILFCITAVCIYFIFFMLVRRQQRARRRDGQEEERGDAEKNKSGVPDFLHCELNDIMGYDFIQIKDIDRTAPKPENEFEDTTGKPGAIHGPVNGLDNELGTTGVTGNYPEHETDGQDTIHLGPKHQQRASDTEQENKKDEEPEGQRISQEQMQLLQMMDEDYEFPESAHTEAQRDQYMDALMNEMDAGKTEEEIITDEDDDDTEKDNPTGPSDYTPEEKSEYKDITGQAFDSLDLMKNLEKHRKEEDEISREIMGENNEPENPDESEKTTE